MTKDVDTDVNPGPAPLVIPRQDHPISRKNIDREALKVMYRLRDAGFTAYLVGGGVRDLYLDKVPKDFDISTNARPGQLRKLFRNSRVIGRRFRLVQVFFPGNKIVEVSTFRCHSEYDLNGNETVLPSNNTFGSPAEDAFRRDLTINALFYEIENYTVIDYVNGVDDLKKGIIRMIGDPDRRITRDPVRMLRTIRHAARSGFRIEEGSWNAIIKHKDKLHLCPVSRVRDELLKDLQGGASKNWVRLAIASHIFSVLFPFYKDVLSDKKIVVQLEKILQVVDRLYKESQRLPDSILFGLLLIPWGNATLGLTVKRQRPEYHEFSRNLRKAVDNNLLHLNLKRAIREEITTLLGNLAVFQAYDQQGKWPKSLKRKSYFNNCLLFYRIYNEAQGGKPVVIVPTEFPAAPRKTTKKKTTKHSSRVPAFASLTKGGIFGFKR